MNERLSPSILVSDVVERRLYLPQLDGLRFVAFFLVLLHHSVSAKDYFSSGSIIGQILTKISAFGWIGVDIFLTLSSFLIVTLLMLEREATKSISISRFYIRRALRIWPLYFGYIIFSLVLLPLIMPSPQPYDEAIKLHLFPLLTFSGNFSYGYFPARHYAVHMWTISLEEQFYLVVPLLVAFAPRKAGGWMAVGFLGLAAAFRLYIQWNQVKYPWLWVLPPCRLDPFVVGAFCAWLYVRKRELLDRINGWPITIVGCCGFATVMQFSDLGTSSLDNVWQFSIIAFSAGCLILSAIAAGGVGLLFSWRPFVFLGKISFGLYVYHLLAIIVEARYVHLADKFGKSPWTWVVTILFVFAGTTLTSVVSYYGFERRFVQMKARFETVKSRAA